MNFAAIWVLGRFPWTWICTSVFFFFVLPKYSRHTIIIHFYFFYFDWFRLVTTKKPLIFLENTSSFAGDKYALDPVLQVPGKRENCRVFSAQICDLSLFSLRKTCRKFHKLSEYIQNMLGSNWSEHCVFFLRTFLRTNSLPFFFKEVKD